MATALTLCPLDNRYSSFVKELDGIFDDFAYTKNRFYAEINYLIVLLDKLITTGNVTTVSKELLNDLISFFQEFEFTKEHCARVGEIEKVTKHDLKAIEYFIKEILAINEKFAPIARYVHFGLTSQDINSLGFCSGFSAASYKFADTITALFVEYEKLIEKTKDTVMLTRTHGQIAVPSIMGKELHVYQYRAKKQLEKFKRSISEITVKFGGAVGNFNSLAFVFPDVDWNEFADKFITAEKFERSQFTKQIDGYESICDVLHYIKSILMVLYDMQQNIWLLIRDEYFVQNVVSTEVGSSTMPQKVNPIHFENARGTHHIVMGLLEGITRSLTESLDSRDLKDSTITRSIPMIFGYAMLIAKQLTEGVKRLEPNRELIRDKLETNQVVIMEGLQTYLKHIGCEDAYERAKDFSRGKSHITLTQIHKEFIDKLDITTEHKDKLKMLCAQNYIGVYLPLS